MFDVDRWPSLTDPVLVLALSGWVDAGFAGAGAAQILQDNLEGAAVVGRADLADLADLQRERPKMHVEEGVLTSLAWPTIEVVAGRVGRDTVVVSGPEPSLRWRGFAAGLVDLAREAGVRRAFTLGGMPAPVVHRRPVAVLATYAGAGPGDQVGPWRPDYEGPTGAQTAVQVALGESGIDAVGLWAQVPPYLASTPSPPAIRALLRRLGEIAGVDVGDLEELDEMCAGYVARVEDELAGRADLAGLVDQLEAAAEDVGGTPFGEAGGGLADEIERFLREQG